MLLKADERVPHLLSAHKETIIEIMAFDPLKVIEILTSSMMEEHELNSESI